MTDPISKPEKNATEQALMYIQQHLKVPKNEYNTYGKYPFRSLAGVLEALKPLLAETKSWITFEDSIVEIAGRPWMKTMLTFETEDSDFSFNIPGFALHTDVQTGMQPAQITGSTSSYARKYALTGMFLLDDSKDDDATNKHGKEPKEQVEKAIVQTPVKPGDTPPVQNQTKKELPWLNNGTKEFAQAIIDLKSGKTLDDLRKTYQISKATEAKLA